MKNIQLIAICSFSVFFSFIANASTKNNIDSLYKELKKSNNDSLTVKIYVEIIEQTYFKNPEKVITLSEELIKITDKAFVSADKNQKYYFLGIKASCYNNIGAIYNQKGDIKNAIEYFHKGLKIKEQINDKKLISSSLNNIGYLYGSIKDYDNALVYYKRSLKIKEQIGDKNGIARLYNNIGSIYDELGDSAKSLQSYRKSYNISFELDNKTGMALALNNIGFTYEKNGEINTALSFYEKSLKFRESVGDKNGIAESLNNIGNIFLDEKKYDKAFLYANKAFAISKELGYPEYIKRSSRLLNEIYLKQKKFEDAYKMYSLYINMRDSMMNEENRDQAIKRAYEYEYEKKSTADSIKNYEIQRYEAIKHEAEINKQKYYTYGGVIGFLLMLIIAVLSYKAYKQKEEANFKITLQNKIIEGKQKEIIDSINYAKRIQDAILPSEKYIGNILSKKK